MPVKEKPNIILIIMDSVRAANLSCYGYSRRTTPHIDTLAEKGSLYEQAFSVGCWTLPVHTSLFTGLYPIAHGVLVSQDALPDGVRTLAARLKDMGYQTASFSSNPYISAGTGLTQGFDTIVDLWQEVKPRGIKRSKMSRLIRKFESFGWPAAPVVWSLRRLQQARAILKRTKSQNDKGAALTNQKIKEWLNQARKPEKPFFFFINYMETHEPYHAPAPYQRRFVPDRYSSVRAAQLGSYKEIASQPPTERRKEDLEILGGLYDGELGYLDDVIGELIRQITELGILDETVIILTSDHGDSLGEHNHIGHRVELYDELLHIPLIVRFPSRFQPGSRITSPVSLVDLYPTILELAGSPAEDANNRDFLSLLSPRDEDMRSFLIAENTAPKSYDSLISRVIRDGRYKFIWKSNQQHELYFLDRDPGERVNLIGEEVEVGRRMQEQLETWMRQHERPSFLAGQAELDDVMLTRLRDLGYVE